MNTTHMRHLATAGLLAATLTGSTVAALPAGASSSTDRRTPVDLSAIKARCDAAIDARQATINNLTSAVGASEHLADGNRSALDGQLASAGSGLTALRTKIDADTDRATLVADCRAIVSQYRIYLVLAPKTRLVIAADRGLAATDAATKAEPRITDAIAKAEGLPALIPADKVADAKARDADLVAKVADASSRMSGLADQLVPLTAQQYNDGTAGPIIDNARQALEAARTDLVNARADLRTIRADLTPVR